MDLQFEKKIRLGLIPAHAINLECRKPGSNNGLIPDVKGLINDALLTIRRPSDHSLLF